MWRRLRKVDEVVGRLVEGATYLVPTLAGSVGGTRHMESWPVIGTRHYDVEYFNIHMPHYHLDLRFVDMALWRGELKQLVTVGVGRRSDGSIPVPVYSKMRCLQAHVIINNVSSNEGARGEQAMHKDFKGKQCAGSVKNGWVCPHKGTFLGGQPPYEGVITCPAHGLKINWKTGRVV